MTGKGGVFLAALLALAAPARADQQTPPSLPSLALDPQAPPPSIWKGLYVGADIFFGAGKGLKGFVGGEGFIGYDRHFDNNLVLGVQASAGFAPNVFAHSAFKGFDYSEATAKIGYQMGRLTPYLETGVALAKPNGAPGAGYSSPTDSINNVFNGSSNLAASGVVGAGVDYALTNNTTVGVGVAVGGGHGFVPPLP